MRGSAAGVGVGADEGSVGGVGASGAGVSDGIVGGMEDGLCCI